MPPFVQPQPFDGQEWRRYAINKLQSFLPKAPPPVWVILFTPCSSAAFGAACVSAKEKVKAFKEAGVPVGLITDDNWQNFASSKQALLSSSTLKVVQFPLPAEILNSPINNDLDLDLTSGRQWPAVCEAAYRGLSILGGLKSNKPIAILGASGFIGKYLVLMLEADGLQVIPLDKDDTLDSLEKAEFVILAASAVGCLAAQYVLKTHIILDLGFGEAGKGAWGGNLTAGGFKKARYATPVPGGMGPAQMAVLIERYQKAIITS